MKADPLAVALPAAFEVASRVLTDTGRAGMQGDDPTPLSDALYRDWYCAVGEKPEVHSEDRDLCELFRVAHAASRRWEDGWRVAKISKRGRVAVTRGRERRVLHVIDCLPEDGDDTRIRPGDTVSVVARRDSETMNPGDYVTFTESWHANRRSALRVYWNVTPAGAPKLIHALSRTLVDTFPYFIKCPRRPAEFDRRDALVLYFPRARFEDATEAIVCAAKMAQNDLRDAVPPLTQMLLPGVGVAEDPSAEDESFGSSRCALVAQGVMLGVSRGVIQPDMWAENVREVFASAGIPSDRPWADSDSSQEYVLP